MRQEVPFPCRYTPTLLLPRTEIVPIVVNKRSFTLNDDKHLHRSSLCLRLRPVLLFLHPCTSDDDSSESGSANGLPALTSPEVLAVGGNPPDGGAPYGEATENGLSAPLDFSTTSPSSSSEDQQPVNLSDRLLPAGSSPPNSYPADPNRKYPIKTEYGNKVKNLICQI